MDLNGTLLYRRKNNRTTFDHRPHFKEFADYVFDLNIDPNSTIVPMIWTSSTPASCDYMLGKLLSRAERDKCVAIWTRDKLGLTPEEYVQKVQVYKNLEKVWADPAIQAAHPWGERFGVRWDQSNTLLLDDSVVKAAYQPYNLINVPELTKERLVKEREKGAVSVLKSVREYLDEARYYANVAVLVKEDPFSMG